MDIGKAIYKILSDNIAVSSMVGTRIAPNVMKQTSAFPFIVYDVKIKPSRGKVLLSGIRNLISTYFSLSLSRNQIRKPLPVNG